MQFFERFERVARDIVEKTTECITILILFGFLVEHIKWKFIQWIALSFLIRQINRKNVNNRCNFELLCHLFVGMGIVATIIFVSLTFHIYTLFHLHILFFALFFLTLFHVCYLKFLETPISILINSVCWNKMHVFAANGMSALCTSYTCALVPYSFSTGKRHLYVFKTIYSSLESFQWHVMSAKMSLKRQKLKEKTTFLTRWCANCL